MNTTATQKTVLLSKHGLKELKHQIARLTHDRMKAIESLRELDKTTGHEERLERIEKLARLELIENELDEKQHLLKTAKPLPSKRARLKVAIGSVVDLIDQQGQLFRYTLVDSFEADPSVGLISIMSPLGQSLIGKTARDIVQWSAGLGAKQLQLVRVM
jgi:transcription elongation GreA/GreB family factor